MEDFAATSLFFDSSMVSFVTERPASTAASALVCPVNSAAEFSGIFNPGGSQSAELVAHFQLRITSNARKCRYCAGPLRVLASTDRLSTKNRQRGEPNTQTHPARGSSCSSPDKALIEFDRRYRLGCQVPLRIAARRHASRCRLPQRWPARGGDAWRPGRFAHMLKNAALLRCECPRWGG